MRRGLVKAELLWSRKCPLNCSYCTMVDGRSNTLTAAGWRIGIQELKKLHCGFIAVYGAEPLAEFDKLTMFFYDAKVAGIETTLITSCCVPNVKDKLSRLAHAGLRSLTVSYDILPHDASSKAKTEKALDTLLFFKEYMKSKLRDVAVVVTLDRNNHVYLPDVIQEMTRNNIWTFFDLYHYDRGQPGTKVAKKNEKLAFKTSDIPKLQETFHKVLDLKKRGFMIHADPHMLRFPVEKLIRYNWQCAKNHWETFPSWITIDCDGSVYPCDDFHDTELPAFFKDEFNIMRISDHWNTWKDYYRKYTEENCPGCSWCTHMQAHLIKQERMSINDYVHGE